MKKDKLPLEDDGVIYAPWERTFTRLLSPFEEFIHRQTTSGLLLMGAAILALVLANSDFAEAYQHLTHTMAFISATSGWICPCITGSTMH